MKTITIQIGNTDNKLTQQDWNKFCNNIKDAVNQNGIDTHFYGCSLSDAPWQNACWVVVSSNINAIENLRKELIIQCEAWHQDSIAFTIGETEFIGEK